MTLNGEFIGYSKDKAKLQAKVNDYIDNGDGENIAFVEIENLPEYKLCLLKKNVVTSDDEIFEKIKQTGINYYTYYAIVQGEEEKLYLSNLNDAQKVLDELNNKNSENSESLSIEQKYQKELRDFVDVETAVGKLYKEKVETTKIASNVTSRSSEKISTSTNISNAKTKIGVSFIKPVNGKLSSKFGAKSSIRSSAHTGLDIATSYGTPIKAAASGTVVFSGTKGSYGKMVIISHGNGVQTYYGHCSSLNVSVGEKVEQGQVISKVGSTGNSTGNHLHLEVRINGTAVNPQNYVY